jgi:copper transport protein
MRHRRERLRRRLVLGAGTALALVLGIALPSAQAHAFLTGSNPADGAVLDTAPNQLVLSFSESVVLTGMRVSVTDGGGHDLPAGEPRLVDAVGVERDATPGSGASTAADPGATTSEGGSEAPVSVAVDLPPLDRGTYRVSWVTVSSDDLHRASGVLVFGVQTTVTAAGWVASARPPTRWSPVSSGRAL